MELTKGSSFTENENNVYISTENANRTIYLADLPKGTSYLEIADYFESKADITSCQIQIKRPLFKHFYFAFVQFQKLEDAQKVLSEHRFPEIKGKKCRALAFHLNSSYPTSTTNPSKKILVEEDCQIFVKNCPKEWTHEDLFSHFIEFGEINSAKISIDANFKSRGFGFVEFKEKKVAVKAIKAMDKKEVDCDADLNSDQTKKVLQVCKYEQKRVRHLGSVEVKTCNNLYVKNFPRKIKLEQDGEPAPAGSQENQQDDYGDDDLRKLFEKYGEISSAVVMRDEEGKSRGFGFVCFKSAVDAKRALDAFNDYQHADASHSSDRLYVAEAKSKEMRQEELMKKSYRFKLSMMYLNLIVKNLDPTTTEEDLHDHFSQFGSVQNTRIVQKGPEILIGFVSFFDREAASKAKSNADKILLKNRHLYISFCEPREVRQLKMEEKIDQKMYQKQ